MSTLELSKHIGKTGQLTEHSNTLRFDVRIIDVKLAYGNVRYQVTPVSGTGSVWVDSSRVKIDAVKPVETAFATRKPETFNDEINGERGEYPVLSVSEQN